MNPEKLWNWILTMHGITIVAARHSTKWAGTPRRRWMKSRKALELDPDNARYHDSCGVTLHEMGRYQEALDESRKALELDPDNARYHDSCSADTPQNGPVPGGVG